MLNLLMLRLRVETSGLAFVCSLMIFLVPGSDEFQDPRNPSNIFSFLLANKEISAMSISKEQNLSHSKKYFSKINIIDVRC